MRKKSIYVSIYLSIYTLETRERLASCVRGGAAPWLYPRQISGLPAWAVAGAVPYRIRYRLLGEASWLGWPRRAVLPSSALRSPSQLAGGLLLASVGAPALPAAEARFAERTDWLARPRPTPGGRRAASIAQSTRLLLSSDLAVILLRTVVRWWHTGSRQMSVCLSV